MKKILIVEDEPASLKLMGAILRGAGYQVVTAQDAIGAVSTAKRERPDLMVLDVNLPGGDALVVIKRLSTMGAMTPLVVVSASEANRQRAVEAGADAFLLKPLDQATFLAAVKSALGEAEVPAPSGSTE
jgi:DNA-binding response OmpR family regulator